MNFDILEKIDHAVLKPNLELKDLEKAVKLACDYPIASLCVYPTWILWLKNQQKNFGDTQIGSVAGFPSGAHDPKVKALEVSLSVCRGATEVDVVVNIAALKNNMYDDIKKELSIVKKAFDVAYNPEKKCIKVILEMCYLTKDQVLEAIDIIEGFGIEYVKTSTGFGEHGATVEEVRFLKENISDKTKIKAAGGIKTLNDVKRMIDAGADRVGTSSTMNIIQEIKSKK